MKLSVLHIGIGNVGMSLVEQIRQFGGNSFVYCGMFTSKAGIFDKNGLSKKEINRFLIDKESDSQVSLEEAISQMPLPFVLVDTTASDKMLPLLKTALKQGGFVVMSNKKPIASSQKDFDELHKLGGDKLYYETTVGAGIPVINTLKTLLGTGDEIITIQGCFSGTLGYIFSEVEKGASFSKAVIEAKKLGFTEPDPRDDLSGVDVARKALILARVSGQKMELSDVKLEGLYPKKMQSLSIEEFMKNLATLDASFATKAAKAKEQNKVLRFAATVTRKGCRARLEAVKKDSELGALQGRNNLVMFQTKRYFDNALTVKGHGAGAEVTAAGVFGDLLEILKRI